MQDMLRSVFVCEKVSSDFRSHNCLWRSKAPQQRTSAICIGQVDDGLSTLVTYLDRDIEFVGSNQASAIHYPSVIRPGPSRLRACSQALYQACPPASSAQEKRGRGRSICG